MKDDYSPLLDAKRSDAGLNHLESLHSAGVSEAMQELSDAVRVVIAMGYAPTLMVGDALGPFVFGDTLMTYLIESVELRGFHLLGEAERMAGAVSESGRQVAVVRYDRIYNVVRLSENVEAHKVTDLNLHLEMRHRYRADHVAADGYAPRIVSLASRGYAFTSAGPRIQPAPDQLDVGSRLEATNITGESEISSWVFALTDTGEPRRWHPHIVDVVAPPDLATHD